MINELDKKIIVMKVLAAGILQPKEAFDFLKTLKFADIVNLGIASELEAKKPSVYWVYEIINFFYIKFIFDLFYLF